MGDRVTVQRWVGLSFTHTRCDEAARIRHQIAKLLRDAGHDVMSPVGEDPP